MQLRDLLPQRVITAQTIETLHQVARKMRNNHVGIVPILEGDRLVGVITDRDITVRAVAVTPSAGYILAKDVQTPHPITIAETADTEDAIVLMREHRLHRLVVIRQNGTVCGIISLTDLSLLGADAFEVLRRLSEKPLLDEVTDEDWTV